jgi:hypothetical protein
MDASSASEGDPDVVDDVRGGEVNTDRSPLGGVKWRADAEPRAPALSA